MKQITINKDVNLTYLPASKTLHGWLPDKLNACLKNLRKMDEERFMLSAYYISNERTKPKIIKYDKRTDEFRLYEVSYANDYNALVLNDKGAWKYQEKFGSKKNGWRVFNINELNDVIRVYLIPEYIMVCESAESKESGS